MAQLMYLASYVSQKWLLDPVVVDMASKWNRKHTLKCIILRRTKKRRFRPAVGEYHYVALVYFPYTMLH